MKNNKGYTLIELLVVSGILVAVSGIIGGILISTLRASDTTRTRTQVAINGNYALSSISELVKRSRNVTYVGNNPQDPSSFNGCIDSPATGNTMTLIMPEGQQVNLTCPASSARIASSSGNITYNLTSRELILVEESAGSGLCSFTCTQATRFSPPSIEIKFRLAQREGANGINQSTEEVFQTQITSRNYLNN